MHTFLNVRRVPYGTSSSRVRTEQGKLHPLRRYRSHSRFAFVQVHEKATQRVAADFLNALLQAVPYKVHTVLTDNGVHFTTPSNRCSAAAEIRIALQRGEIFVPMPSSSPAPRPASTTGSPNPNIVGPTARSSA